jgi:hypothetical protein
LIAKGIVLKPGKHPRKIESSRNDSRIKAPFSEKDGTRKEDNLGLSNIERCAR